MVNTSRVVNGQIILEDENIIREVKCFGCRHLLFYPTCAAYLEGIPQGIRNGDSDHTLPFGGERLGFDGKPIIYQPLLTKDELAKMKVEREAEKAMTSKEKAAKDVAKIKQTKSIKPSNGTARAETIDKKKGKLLFIGRPTEDQSIDEFVDEAVDAIFAESNHPDESVRGKDSCGEGPI